MRMTTEEAFVKVLQMHGIEHVVIFLLAIKVLICASTVV